jgi:predicted SAM-dependent methyltransferase
VLHHHLLDLLFSSGGASVGRACHRLLKIPGPLLLDVEMAIVDGIKLRRSSGT